MDLTNKNIDVADAIRKFEPKAILVAYQQEESSCYYLEKADIVNNQIQAYHPASIEEIKSIVTNITAVDQGYVKSPGLLPKCILALSIIGSDFKLVWWKRRAFQRMKFDEQLKLKNKNISVPAIIYVATRTELRVFCFIKESAPNLKTKIMQAPYFNVFSDGRVCQGNATVKLPMTTSLEQIISEYEKFFWNSEFTDSGCADYKKQWKTLSDMDMDVFHNSWLKKHKTIHTLKDLLK